MTFAELIDLVRDWQRTPPPDEVRGKIADACEMITFGGRLVSAKIDVDALLAFASSSKSFEERDANGLLHWPKLQPPRRQRKRRKAARAAAQLPSIDASRPRLR